MAYNASHWFGNVSIPSPAKCVVVKISLATTISPAASSRRFLRRRPRFASAASSAFAPTIPSIPSTSSGACVPTTNAINATNE